MSGYFGIDCATNDWQLAIQKTTEAIGVVKFLGQYLPVYPTDKERVAAILAAKLPIVAIWNGDQNGAIIGSSDPSNMVRQAKIAAAAWASLGLPKGSAIFYDVEAGFYFDPAAAGKWITVISAAGYTPGFYLNPVSGNNHAAGYQAARRATTNVKCVYWTNEWELTSYANKALTDLIIGPDYAAIVPGYESELVAWQYSENQLGGLVDLDVARNLDYFWKPAVPTLIWHIKSTCALKPPPNTSRPPSHTTPSEHTCFGGDLVKLLDHEQTVKNPATGKLEIWSEISIAGKTGALYTGWVLKDNLYHD